MQKQEFYTVLNNGVETNSQKLEDLKTLVDEFPYFQVAQVLYLKGLKEMSHPDYDMVLKKVAVSVPDRRKLYKFLNSQLEIVQTSENIHFESQNQPIFNLELESEIQSGNSLIDKFLASSPGVIARKYEGNENLKDVENEVLKKSVEEDDEIVTETLAIIYFQQKKYEKAQNAFRKLSLKYPEKSVYFASRIEEIEKLKNI